MLLEVCVGHKQFYIPMPSWSCAKVKTFVLFIIHFLFPIHELRVDLRDTGFILGHLKCEHNDVATWQLFSLILKLFMFSEQPNDVV